MISSTVHAPPPIQRPLLVTYLLPVQSVVDQSLDITGWAFQGRVPFKQHLGGYKYPERDLLHPQPQVHHDRAVACLLQPLDKLLGSQRILVGSEPCLADLAIFPFIRQYRAVDMKWFDGQDRQAIRRWLEAWLESQLFQRCMRK